MSAAQDKRALADVSFQSVLRTVGHGEMAYSVAVNGRFAENYTKEGPDAVAAGLKRAVAFYLTHLEAMS